ncbi:MAG: Ig-like domain-containing protein [Gemmatimonadales bacterium]|nr:Ig-like domain-containing protein [Gemmatimonadales bacterium]
MLLLLAALLQQPAPARAASPIVTVEVTPATAELGVGQTLQLSARALDKDGKPVPGAQLRYFADGSEGSVGEETGLVTAGYQGYVRITVVAGLPGTRPAFGEATIRVLPAPVARVDIAPKPAKLLAGTRLTLQGTPYSGQNDRRTDAVTFTSSDPKVVSITPDGRLTANAAGRATLTAEVGKVKATHVVQVVGGTVGKFAVAPAQAAVRTGDVVRLGVEAKLLGGQDARELPVRWALAALPAGGVAQVDDEGAFVAETPGKYTVTATLGGRTADAVVTVTPRRVGRGMEVLGRVPLAFQAAEVWVHPSGKCAYQSTIADRVYAIDVSTPGSPRIVDSMLTDARLVNDVMTTADGRYGVFSREGASNRKNGIAIFDASDPCHPKVISEYTATVSGGVHSSFVYENRVYLTDDATGSLRVIDIINPYEPREVGRWQAEQSEAGRYVHDVDVQDGLAYLSYWNDGLIILDVGNGVKGGSPSNPRFVAQVKYDLNEVYARVDQYYGLAARGTHTAWRKGKYVFVGDEVYAAKPHKGLDGGNDLTWGRLHVIDVSDLTKPKMVAWYEPTDAGVHNIWAAGDTLYIGSYQGGVRALDISGELRGDLLRQGREMAWSFTADDKGVKPRATFTWGVVVKDGVMYVPDINTGLWIMKLEPKRERLMP